MITAGLMEFPHHVAFRERMRSGDVEDLQYDPGLVGIYLGSGSSRRQVAIALGWNNQSNADWTPQSALELSVSLLDSDRKPYYRPGKDLVGLSFEARPTVGPDDSADVHGALNWLAQELNVGSQNAVYTRTDIVCDPSSADLASVGNPDPLPYMGRYSSVNRFDVGVGEDLVASVETEVSEHDEDDPNAEYTLTEIVVGRSQLKLFPLPSTSTARRRFGSPSLPSDYPYGRAFACVRSGSGVSQNWPAWPDGSKNHTRASAELFARGLGTSWSRYSAFVDGVAASLHSANSPRIAQDA